MSTPSVLLVGAGNMGGAMLRGWLAQGHPADKLAVLDPHMTDAFAAEIHAAGVRRIEKADAADVVVVAVKPQVIGDVLPTLVPALGVDSVVISIAAGTTLAQLAAPLPDGTAIVRAMPNTPAQVRRGVTVCVANEAVSSKQRQRVSDLMAAIGSVEWLEDEALMDAVTGVSGSGPAYVFHMIEALQSAAVAAGLPDEMAARLARATVCGAAELAYQSDLPAATLRQNVTSPGGTTAAGLAVLGADDALTDLMTRTVAAAARRSQELSA